MPIKLAQLHFAMLGPRSLITVSEEQWQLLREGLHSLFLGKVEQVPPLLHSVVGLPPSVPSREDLWDAGWARSQPGCHHASTEHQNCSSVGGGFGGCCCYRSGCSITIPIVLLRISYFSMKLKRRLPPKALLFCSLYGSEVLRN